MGILCRQYSTFAFWGSKSAVLSAHACHFLQTVHHFCCLEWQKCCTVCRKLPQPSLDPVVGPPLDPAPEVHGIIRTLIINTVVAVVVVVVVVVVAVIVYCVSVSYTHLTLPTILLV